MKLETVGVFLVLVIGFFVGTVLLMLWRAASHTRAVDRGCTCPDAMYWNETCPVCSWKKKEKDKQKCIVLTRREDGGADLMIDDDGRITEIDLPKRPADDRRDKT